MNPRDPKLIALLFNECINDQDLSGLTRLMTENHAFIDREGRAHGPKQVMVDGWRDFFKMFPHYRNTFTRVESRGNLVIIQGYAYWSEQQTYDPVIWTATIVHDMVREWRVDSDSEENRKRFHLRDLPDGIH